MSQTDVVQVQPVKLTQKLGRYTKGLMTSIAIILVSTAFAYIGLLVELNIMMIVGFVITGLSTIIFLVFMILFLTSIVRLGRIDDKYFSSTKRIFGAFLYGLVFAIAGGANTESTVDEFLPQYFLSRIYGIVALVLFGIAFLSINNLFEKLKQDKLFPKEEKRKYTLPILVGIILLVVLIDTIVRAVVYAVLLNQGQYANWIYDHFEIFLNYAILAIMVILVAIFCYFLYGLGEEWLKIDEELNTQYFKMGGKTFNDKLKSNIMQISNIAIIIASLSLVYVIYYFITYVTTEDFIPLIFAIGIFLGVMIIFLIIYIIRLALNYNKMAQLNSKTSNYGIFTAISLSFSPFLIIAGFFSNIEFYIDHDLYIIARILFLVGVLLFAGGSIFNYIILKNLKLNKEGFEVRKKDLILPISSIVLFVLLLVDTIVRKLVWIFAYKANSIDVNIFNSEFLWFGYLMSALFFITVIPTIFGIVTTSKEYLKVIPAYGKIPLRIKKSRIDEEIQLYQAGQEMVPSAKAVAYEATEKEIVVFCGSCGKELLARYNFCVYCGTKKDSKLKTCPNCGEVLEKGFVFCPHCGKKK